MSTTMEKIFTALSSVDSFRASTANSLLSGGMALYQKKRYKEAIAAFKQATAYKPDLLDGYNLMAQAYTQLKDNKGAISAYKISIGLDKTQGNVHMAMGNIYMADQNYVEAEKSLKAAAKADPTSALPVYTLGLVYKQTGRNTEAEEMFKKTVKLSPGDGNPHYALGSLYNEQGRYDEAVTELQHALQLKTSFPLANSELGKAYLALDKRDLAKEQLDILKDKDRSLYNDLNSKMAQPKILFATGNSSFKFELGPTTGNRYTTLQDLTPEDIDTPEEEQIYDEANAGKDFTMVFQFNREMDVSSVTNVMNWNIFKASGGTAGLYANGLYRPNEARIPMFPKSVIYDPTTMQAKLTFSLSQVGLPTGDSNGIIDENESAIIDPSHMVFKFMGKDVDGRSMDPDADEWNYFGDSF